MQQQTYSIGDASSKSGASKKQIRNWEVRGHIPKAGRVISGSRAYRRFSLEHVELISRIKALRDEGYTLTTAAKIAKTSNPEPRKESTPSGSSE